ncbi:STAS domain-containing protein [Streptomyces sp. NBC_00162]|uniref:STAS domain-containing protein n=1 Tax=Streptomyces sp. NBC_00162 TaxID=2903629 RepID=UPI00214A97BD|nr:STAS domain-containing protein [Streptomyces sp. NBC_00162]UUU44370.1 STAS domain-containing protein [Streptomyces sp. NBC_00162]
MNTTQVQHCGSSVLVSVGGELDEEAGTVLQQALDGVAIDARDLMVDLHGVVSMDSGGLLHVLELHRRAECLGLRVLVIGWQPQPQQLMAQIAGIRGPGSATGERYALAGFRRLLEQRAQHDRHFADFGVGTPILSTAPGE